MVPDEFFDYFADLIVFKTVQYDIDQDTHVLFFEKEFLDTKERCDQSFIILVQVKTLNDADLVTLYLVEETFNEGDIEFFPVGK